ncbi:C6 transcription factor SndA [Penicillium samsonianum]|uniref:C6 transcription factor SndA n=1 Tax=Penicillium samsonianum TaxID=1882272 RepID=UPI0025491D42|nr:C6 transcription factor SndA [Penicillium samsonianum]KAJ6139014.1 C6 transcription factor SndA [Penicillium samsonianum]
MSEQTPRGYRPLAPRTRLLGGGDAGEGAGSPSGGSAPEEKRMRRASTACTECQKRRTRCTGPPHCTECSTHARECVFDEAADRRRKASAKRIQDQLDHFRSFVDDLLGLIRDSDRPTVQLIVNTIRSGATPGQIRETLTRLLEDDSQFDSRNSGVRDSDLNLNITPNSNMGNYYGPHR